MRTGVVYTPWRRRCLQHDCRGDFCPSPASHPVYVRLFQYKTSGRPPTLKYQVVCNNEMCTCITSFNAAVLQSSLWLWIRAIIDPKDDIQNKRTDDGVPFLSGVYDCCFLFPFDLFRNRYARCELTDQPTDTGWCRRNISVGFQKGSLTLGVVHCVDFFPFFFVCNKHKKIMYKSEKKNTRVQH